MSVSSTLRISLIALSAALPLAAGAAFAQTPPAPPPTVAPAPAVDPAKVVVRVNGLDITEGDLAVATADAALQLPNIPDEQKRELLIGYLVDIKLGARAAEAAKVGEGADFARKLAYNRDKTLLDQYLDLEAKKAVTPEAAKALYEETIKSMPGEEEVRARHILVEKEEDAKKAQARVKGGEDFNKVAAELSTDPGSKTDGGDLGFFTKDRMVEPFAEAAFKLQPGQISDPVQSQFGWHVIKVEEKRTKPVPSLDEMRTQVNTYLERKAQQDLIVKLRASAKIERPDDKGNLVEQKKP